jgi:hypothetical protein
MPWGPWAQAGIQNALAGIEFRKFLDEIGANVPRDLDVHLVMAASPNCAADQQPDLAKLPLQLQTRST